ncbi:MAG TPA: type IX secretion system membrane protein PorP/SprF, partial [Bacteroidia bacterium]|nr:type IX secretion system membrane protein PorP/SprF [Bacteroidia bacterium]
FPVWINPSFAGSTGTLRVEAAYRNQWPDLDANYVTTTIGADAYVPLLHAGIALGYMNDIAGQGIFRTNRIDLAWAQQIHLFDHKLTVTPSLDVAYLQKTLDLSKLTFGTMINPRNGFVYNTGPTDPNKPVQVADISAGLLLYTRNFCAGFSMFHLNRPDIGFFGPSYLDIRYTTHLSYTFHLTPDKDLCLTPSLIYSYQSGATEFVPALSVAYKVLRIGFGIRTNDALILMAGFRNNRFSVSYSYDNTTSGLNNAVTGGSHEISLQAYLLVKHKPENFLSCPSFF